MWMSSLLLVLLDASIKATLLAGIGVGCMALLRVRNGHLRHRVWSGVLVGMLLMPALTQFLPSVSIPVRRSTWVTSIAADTVSNTPEDPATVPEPVEAISKTIVAVPEPHASSASYDAATPIPIAAPQAPTISQTIRGALIPALAATYLLIGCLLLTRLLAGLVLTARLIRSSQPLTQVHVLACESNVVSTPVTVGFLRPRIVLPATWKRWSSDKLKAVVSHELTHISRKDYVINLLAEINRCVNWFHPLSWILVRRLSDLAEQNCDDAVIAVTGERATYARHLLEIAASSVQRGRVLPASSSMARSADVESRIEAILDADRPLSQSLSWRKTVALVAVILPIVWLAAAIRPMVAQAENESVVKGDSAGKSLTSKLKVVTDDEQPIANAAVVVTYFAMGDNGHQHSLTKLASTQTDGAGRVNAQYVQPDERDRRGATQTLLDRHGTQAIVKAEGYSIGFPDHNTWWLSHQGDSQTIRLEPSHSLTGKLVDLEGQPVAEAEIDVTHIASASKPLDDWWKLAVKNPRQGDAMMFATADPFDSSNSGPRAVPFPEQETVFVHGLLPTATTKNDGSFQIPNLGKDRLVTLRVRSSKIARCTVQMITHPGPSIYNAYPGSGASDGRMHGNGATIALEPAASIRGVIQALGTNKPIAGCQITVEQVPGSLLNQRGYATATSEESGEYVLDRLPLDPPNSRGFRIRVTPPADAPFFPTEYQVRLNGKSDVTHNVQLKQARWVTGKVTDHRTGKPVRALVGYLPFVDNKNAEEYDNFQAGMRTILFDDFRWNNDDGTFQVPAIEGRGALCVTAEHLARFRWGDGVEEIDGLLTEKKRLGLYHLMLPTMANTYREINLDSDDVDPHIDVQLHSLNRYPIRLVDQEGKEVVGCRVTGLLPSPPMANRQHITNLPPVESSTMDVIGLEAESPRYLAAYHNKRKIGAIVELRPEDFTAGSVREITLPPVGEIKGRLLDSKGDPVVDRYVYAMVIAKEHKIKMFGRERPPFRMSTELVKTDTDGRFAIHQYVFPNMAYQVQSHRSQQTIKTDIVPAGKAIDVGDLKLAGPKEADKSAQQK